MRSKLCNVEPVEPSDHPEDAGGSIHRDLKHLFSFNEMACQNINNESNIVRNSEIHTSCANARRLSLPQSYD